MVRVTALSKHFSSGADAVLAVDGVSFQVPEGKLYTLLGPSGCGKTTTLRCVAGLEHPESGEIEIAGQTVFSSERGILVRPERRPIGMVFQSYAIWPHMSVFDNVAFPLQVEKPRPSRAEIRRRVEEVLALVELSGLEGRQAPQLSGGQQQRLALARALIREPRVLLLDEPLSNLDAQLREHMRSELRDLQQRLQITTVFVTHDQIEALAMSDVMGVMQHGRIVQEGTPKEIYGSPQTQFVAQFIGSTNVIEGKPVRGPDAGGLVRLATPLGELECPIVLDEDQAGEVRLAIRPEDVIVHRAPVQTPAAALATKGDGGAVTGAREPLNVVRGRVAKIEFLGGYLDCRVAVNGTTVFTRQHPSLAVEVNQSVWLELPPAAWRRLS